MTCRATSHATGSAADHDLLVQAFVAWRLRQSASDLMWTNADEADDAHKARGALLCHAMNCGFDIGRHGDLIHWAAKRVNHWGRECGRSAMEIDVVLGEFAAAARRAI